MLKNLFSRQSLTSTTALLLSIAAAKVLIHVLTNQKYGYHRDEFYYIVGGQRLSWGYVDHPPMTPLLAEISRTLLGDSPGGLRLLPALAGGVIVFLAGKMAKELGGGRNAQLLAALSVVALPIFLGTNTMFQTVTFDQLIWAIGLYGLIRLLKTGDSRYWLLLGLVAGLGLQTKYTIVFFGLGMTLGLLLTPHRKHFQTAYPYLGGLIALVIFAPNLLWQIQNDFPTLEFTRNNNANFREDESLLNFFVFQVFAVGPILLPMVLAGLRWLFSEEGKPYRPIGWIYVISLVLMVVQRAKPYYLAPMYPVLVAAGAVFIENFIRQRHWNSQRSTRILAAVVVLNGIIPAPIVLPILPEKVMAENELWDINNDFGEMVGWEELVAQVEAIYAGLPPEDRAQATILTGSYGEASAIDVLGQNLPPAISGHNSYSLWGVGDATGAVVIAIRLNESFLRDHWREVEQVGTITNPYAIENETYQTPIFVCRQPKAPLKEMWADFKHYE